MINGKTTLKFLLKIIITIVIFFSLFYILILSSCSKTEKFNDVNQIEEKIREVRGAETHIPNDDELGEYESIELLLKETKYSLWTIDSLTLKVKYDASEFNKAINGIDLRYSFLKEAKEDLLDYNAIIDGYEIQIVEKIEKMQSDYSYDYPKCFMMIGVNKQEQTIVYLYHYDIDLDSIDDLDDFIDKYYILE